MYFIVSSSLTKMLEYLYVMRNEIQGNIRLHRFIFKGQQAITPHWSELIPFTHGHSLTHSFTYSLPDICVCAVGLDLLCGPPKYLLKVSTGNYPVTHTLFLGRYAAAEFNFFLLKCQSNLQYTTPVGESGDILHIQIHILGGFGWKDPLQTFKSNLIFSNRWTKLSVCPFWYAW